MRHSSKHAHSYHPIQTDSLHFKFTIKGNCRQQQQQQQQQLAIKNHSIHFHNIKKSFHSLSQHIHFHNRPGTTTTMPTQQYTESEEEDWVSMIRTIVGKQLFDTIQFITLKKDEMFGSPWQKQVCLKVGVREEHQQLFWKRKGIQEARRSLNRRRQNTTNAMKKHFLGKNRHQRSLQAI